MTRLIAVITASVILLPFAHAPVQAKGGASQPIWTCKASGQGENQCVEHDDLMLHVVCSTSDGGMSSEPGGAEQCNRGPKSAEFKGGRKGPVKLSR